MHKSMLLIAVAALVVVGCPVQALQAGDPCPDGSPAIVCITTPCDQCPPRKPPPTDKCPAPVPQCLVFPCDPRFAVCKAFPNATCRPDCNCGRDFVDSNGLIVDCDSKVDVCSLPSDSGPCEAAIPSWFFNNKIGACDRFTYGGCQGNGNRFDTVQECQKRCGGVLPTGPSPPGPSPPPSADVCSLPSETGPCKARIPRWFYNSKIGRCEKFIYGGCQGNGNRFSSEAECKQRCGGITTPPVGSNPCTLPQDVGPCDGVFPRFYFNSKKGICESFSFGGCQGNANNFKTLGACTSKCLSGLTCSPKDGLCGVSGLRCCNGLQCCKRSPSYSTSQSFSFSVGKCGRCLKG